MAELKVTDVTLAFDGRNIIEDINTKIKEIDKQMIIVEDIKPNFGAMDNFIPELEAAYKEFEKSLSNSIFRTQALNKIVAEDAINEYYDIFQQLNSECTDIINELLESVKTTQSPVEVLDMYTSSNMTASTDWASNNQGIQHTLINKNLIEKQIGLTKKIPEIDIPRDVIPVPTPIVEEMEVLEM
jgi:hypothetical protein